MTKIKVKIINGFRKTSSFGWRFVPKWKIEFIRLNGVAEFKKLVDYCEEMMSPISEKEGRNYFKSLATDFNRFKQVDNTKYPDVFKFHNGLDFVGSDNKLLAIADGIIMEVENSPLSGNYIKVLYKFDGVEYLLSYCHLKTHTPSIENDTVKKGEWIGVMGNSGVTSTGVHCHLTVKNFETNEVIDPETIFEFEV